MHNFLLLGHTTTTTLFVVPCRCRYRQNVTSVKVMTDEYSTLTLISAILAKLRPGTTGGYVYVATYLATPGRG